MDVIGSRTAVKLIMLTGTKSGTTDRRAMHAGCDDSVSRSTRFVHRYPATESVTHVGPERRYILFCHCGCEVTATVAAAFEV